MCFFFTLYDHGVSLEKTPIAFHIGTLNPTENRIHLFLIQALHTPIKCLSLLPIHIHRNERGMGLYSLNA